MSTNINDQPKMSTTNKQKTRVTIKMFMSGSTIKSHWVIEAKMASGWMLVGDDNGILKFATKEEAEKAADDFNK